MKWDILNKIAEGTSSSVYKVKHQDSDEIAALKVIHPAYRKDKDYRRLKRSFISASKLSHKNCVRMIEWVESEKIVGFVMEYVDGKSITFNQLKDKNGLIDVNNIILIFIQICNGLQELHSNNIIHRDLKPENILIDKKNNIKLTDFDFAKIIESVSLTVKGLFLGTVRYSSPEQCTNSNRIDVRSDLYSLGVILYEVLTGMLPFDGESFTEIALKHINAPLISPEKYSPSLPDPLIEVVKKLLSKNPKNRYQSAKELSIALMKLLKEPISEHLKIKNTPFLPSFTGRGKVIQQFYSAYEKTSKGKLKFILISGASGVGKTKLWEEFSYDLNIKQCPVIEINCNIGSPSFEPLIRILQKIINNIKEKKEEEKAKIIGSLGWDLSLIYPEIGELSFMKHIEKLPPLKGSEAEKRLFDSMSNVLVNYSNDLQNSALKTESKKPFVIFLDDIHQADHVILRWLIYIIRTLRNYPFLIISTFRAEYSDNILFKKILNTFDKEDFFEIIKLEPLNQSESKELIKTMLLEPGELDSEFSKLIYKLSGGNPLFIIEIVQHLMKVGKDDIKESNEDKYKVIIKDLISLQDVIKKRLEHLDPEDRKLLQIASVVGTTFNISLLEEVSGYIDTVVLSAIEKARSLFLVDLEESEESYKFRHEIIRKTIYEEINKENNIKIHALIADFYEKKYMKTHQSNKKILKSSILDYNRHIFRNHNTLIQKLEESVIKKLAYHYYLAEIVEKTVIYNDKAAQLSKMQFAHEKALSYYMRIIEVLEKDMDKLKIIYFLHKAGEILEILGQWGKCEEIYKKALGFSKKIKDKKKIAISYYHLAHIYRRLDEYVNSKKYYEKSISICEKIDELFILARSKGELGIVLSKEGNYKRALKLYNDQLEISKGLNDVEGLASALNYIGTLHFTRKNFDLALDYYNKSKNVSEKLEDKKYYSMSLVNIGNIYASKNDFDSALEYYDKYLKINQKLQNKSGILLYLINTAGIYYHRNNLDKALSNCLKGLEICDSIGEKEYKIGSLNHIAKIYFLKGELNKVQESLTKALSIAEGIGDKEGISKTLNNLIQLNILNGEFKIALKYIDISIENDESLGNKHSLALKYFNRAEVLYFIGKLDKSKCFLLKAMDILKDLKYEFEIFMSEVFLLRLEYQQDENSEIIAKLENMISSSKEIKRKAEIYYSLWKIKKDANYGIILDEILIKILENERDIRYKRIQIELHDFKKTQINCNEMNNKHKLIKSLVRFMNPETAYNEFLQYLIEDRKADCAQIIIKTDGRDKGLYRRILSPGISTEDADFSNVILQKVLSGGEPLLIENAIENPNLKNNPSIIGKLFLSVLAIPLKQENGISVGALYIDRRDISKKPFKSNDLQIVIDIADILTPVLVRQEHIRNIEVESEVHNLGLFIGSSKVMQDLYSRIEEISKVDLIVSIHGETGSGKELVAKAIHKLSNRSNKPFIPVNCSAIPKNLAETELFGYMKGAFSGAVSTNKGKFELAHEGIVFLDEIAELPLQIQSKLLRVIQNNEIWKVGGQKPIEIDTRILVSTHKDILEEVKKGNFREDLYYRLNVLKIEVPTLRDRREDIPLLAYNFLKNILNKINRHITGFTPEAITKMQSYHWPGNVRELENSIAKAVVQHKGSNPIDGSEILSEFKSDYLHERDNYSIEFSGSLKTTMKSIEKKIISKTLSENNWNISKTAKILNVSRVQLYRLIEKYNLTK